MTGHVDVKPRIGLDPCKPSCPHGDCANCVRFDLQVADDPAQRPSVVVLDGSKVKAEGRCALFVARPAQARAHLPVAAARPSRRSDAAPELPAPAAAAEPAKRPKTGGSAGMRSLEDIRGRCVITDNGCWHWRGGFTGGRQPVPRTHVSMHAAIEGAGAAMTVYRAAWLFDGRVLKPGQLVYRAKCHDHRCVNPAHCAAGTRQQMLAAAKAGDRLKGDTHRAIVNTANRLRMVKPREVIEQIERMLADGRLQKDICADLRVDSTVVARVRNRTHPHCSAAQRVAPGASVFAWRPAA